MPRKKPSFTKGHGFHWQKRQPDYEDCDGNNPLADVDVGNSLRKMREARNLSLRVLAEQSGLAINTLSLIENQKSSPSVSTLQQLAVALGVPITAFFENQVPKKNIAFVKADQRPRAIFNHGILENLSSESSVQSMQPFVLSLNPHASSGKKDIVHTGHELVYCLEGRIEYMIEGRTYVLEPGDSLFFEAHLPHRWQNIDSTVARAILVLHPSDERDSPTERHFMPEKT